jgi:hypothetical protein
MTTYLVLDALELALYPCELSDSEDLIHDSDRDSQYVSIRYTERLG